MDEQNGSKVLRKQGAKACTACRAVKMRCNPIPGSVICERCTRKSIECLFHQKKRGRKPTKILEEQGPQVPEAAGPVEAESQKHQLQHTPVQGRDAESDFWASSEGLQPSSLLNEQAAKGKFSLENILSTSHDNANHSDESGLISSLPEDDPVLQGMVSYHVASSLFEGFMKRLNPLICVMDPELHTFSYVRERSSFLLTVILTAASKAFNPPLHPELFKHSEKLFLDSFARNAKSTEVIQAIMLNTYWKQPDDTRSWSTIGYAIRLGMELGWHKSSIDNDARHMASELERRQRRDVERTWFVLFVYDRNMSLQTGKPWMIERGDFIESVNTWYKSPLAISNDATLAALVTLRLASADVLEVFSPQRPAPSMAYPYRAEALLKTLNVQIEAWKKHWGRVLQASISSPIGASLVDTEAFWITYTSALEMLRLVSHPSLSSILSLLHDSIHAMTAYAAGFLIKVGELQLLNPRLLHHLILCNINLATFQQLLLSVNRVIRQEYEKTVIEALKLASSTFGEQTAPPNFSCSLQANFLKNLVLEYQKACRRRLGRIETEHKDSEPRQPTLPEQTIPKGREPYAVSSWQDDAKALPPPREREVQSHYQPHVVEVQENDVSPDVASEREPLGRS
ncbi:hypothetical protein FGRMN_1436 [Fusarium graminum]|nr:hypothetical protein FGRMN_1436 [Fusarium graminum]